MENNEKKVIQISLSQFIILIVLLIILICVGVGLYVSALRKSNTESEIQAINEQENIIDNMLNNLNNVVVNEEQADNNVTTQNTSYGEYVSENKEITSTTLGEKDVFFVTEAIDNGNSYELKGVIYKHDDDNHNDAQISDRWILTNEQYTITVLKTLPCNKLYDYEDKYQTVDDVFSNYKKIEPTNTSNPYYEYSYRFIFKNDKCVEMENILTGLEK